jgi:hypothetical protein
MGFAPSTKPSLVDTNVTDAGWNPMGTGAPAGWLGPPVSGDVDVVVGSVGADVDVEGPDVVELVVCMVVLDVELPGPPAPPAPPVPPGPPALGEVALPQAAADRERANTATAALRQEFGFRLKVTR